MSLFFMGVLKIDEDVIVRNHSLSAGFLRLEDFSRELTRAALDYGYGIQIGEYNIPRPRDEEGDPVGTVIQRMKEKLGGTAIPFYLASSPYSGVADMFNEIPMNRDTPEKINFFHFLRRIWSISGGLRGAFLVWDSSIRFELIKEMHVSFDDMIADLRRKEAFMERWDLYYCTV